MLDKLIKGVAKAKALAKKREIREKVGQICLDDINTFIEAIENERDIIPLLPDFILEALSEQKPGYIKALADADFLLGLTDEILPEYSEFLRGREAWLGRQLEMLKEIV